MCKRIDVIFNLEIAEPAVTIPKSTDKQSTVTMPIWTGKPNWSLDY